MKQNYFTKISFTDNIFLSARRGFLQIPRSAFFFRLPPVFCRDILIRVFYILYRLAYEIPSPPVPCGRFRRRRVFSKRLLPGKGL